MHEATAGYLTLRRRERYPLVHQFHDPACSGTVGLEGSADGKFPFFANMFFAFSVREGDRNRFFAEITCSPSGTD